MKLKTRPSLKLRRRYLLLEAKNKEEVEKTILDYIGILGWAKASPKFVENSKNKQLVLAINRAELSGIRAAFEVSPKKIKISKVSGTLKGLEK